MIVRHFGFIWNSFLSNKLFFFDLTILKIEDDNGRQPITSTPVKDRAGGSTGKHSLTPSSKCANEPNRKRHQRTTEGFEGSIALSSGATAGYMNFIVFKLRY